LSCQWSVFLFEWICVRFDSSVSSNVWSEGYSLCNDPVSDSDSAAMICAVNLSAAATIQHLRQCAPEGRRTQDHGKRSNAQAVTPMETKGRSHTSGASTGASYERWVTDICPSCTLLGMETQITSIWFILHLSENVVVGRRRRRW
jgi:hypothetical protein